MEKEMENQLSPDMSIGMPKGKLSKYLSAPKMDDNYNTEQNGWASDQAQLTFKKQHQTQDE